jgi:hypothetical protein
MSWNDQRELRALLGKTLLSVESDDNIIIFRADDGSAYQMYHQQDCCEHVYIESITGDLSDLVGSPIVVAEESKSDVDPDGHGGDVYGVDSQLWTFYKLATVKGWVDIRWYGSSNGYYGVTVNFEQITN